MSISAVIVAGGKGTRMNASVPKQFLTLNKKPILFYTLQKFNDIPQIDEICLVIPKEFQEDPFIIKAKSLFSKLKYVISGGKERQDSVYNGLSALNPKTKIVLIQDGVRPFTPLKSILKSIDIAKKFGAALVAIPSTDTVKILCPERGTVSTPDRSTVWLAQTPQTFQYQLILKAYQKIKTEHLKITDDAQAVEIYGHEVKIVEGSVENIKITNKNDLKLAQEYLKTENKGI